VDWLHATAANLHILSWGRSFGSSGSSGRHVTQASPWLTLDTDNKCVSAVLRHPGCSSSCSMLLHMAVSGARLTRSRTRRCLQFNSYSPRSFKARRSHPALRLQRRRHHVCPRNIERHIRSG